MAGTWQPALAGGRAPQPPPDELLDEDEAIVAAYMAQRAAPVAVLSAHID